jgi:hypothetical protein
MRETGLRGQSRWRRSKLQRREYDDARVFSACHRGGINISRGIVVVTWAMKGRIVP